MPWARVIYFFILLDRMLGVKERVRLHAIRLKILRRRLICAHNWCSPIFGLMFLSVCARTHFYGVVCVKDLCDIKIIIFKDIHKLYLFIN